MISTRLRLHVNPESPCVSRTETRMEAGNRSRLCLLRYSAVTQPAAQLPLPLPLLLALTRAVLSAQVQERQGARPAERLQHQKRESCLTPLCCDPRRRGESGVTKCLPEAHSLTDSVRQASFTPLLAPDPATAAARTQAWAPGSGRHGPSAALKRPVATSRAATSAASGPSFHAPAAGSRCRPRAPPVSTARLPGRSFRSMHARGRRRRRSAGGVARRAAAVFSLIPSCPR